MPDPSVSPSTPLVPFKLLPQCWSSEGVSLSRWVHVWVLYEELPGSPAVSCSASIPAGFCSQKLWELTNVFLALEPWAGRLGMGLGYCCGWLRIINHANIHVSKTRPPSTGRGRIPWPQWSGEAERSNWMFFQSVTFLMANSQKWKRGQVEGLRLFFFFLIYLLIMLLQSSHFPPFIPLHPAHPLPFFRYYWNTILGGKKPTIFS